MTKPQPCPAAPGPLEDYCVRFDQLLRRLPQRRGFRDYLAGLLAPSERHKTLTGLADTEPVTGASHPEAQRLQFFLTESVWDADAINDLRLRLLCEDPATAPHPGGVLIIDDSGHPKDGHATEHVARQYLGQLGKVDRGIVITSSLWADEGVYWPVGLTPYTPACRLPRGDADPAFRTKPQQAAELVAAAVAARVPFRAVVADCFYGDNQGFVTQLDTQRAGFVLAVKPRTSTWTADPDTPTPTDAARKAARGWHGPERPGRWRHVERQFHDGHTEAWWAADVPLPEAGWGPDRPVRLVVATTDPARLPGRTTWYLLTNLPRRGRSRHGHPAADLEEIVRLYGLRNWVEQGYKQVKQELGWADFQVRSDRAIRRHLTLVCCAFSFCWQAQRTPDPQPPTVDADHDTQPPTFTQGAQRPPPSALDPRRIVADRPAPRPKLADPLAVAAALVAGLVNQPTSPARPGHARLGHRRQTPVPLRPNLN
jgi:SRSO17 transposase